MSACLVVQLVLVLRCPPQMFEFDCEVYFAYPRIEVFRFKVSVFQVSLLNLLMFFKYISPTSGLTRLLYLQFLFHSK